MNDFWRKLFKPLSALLSASRPQPVPEQSTPAELDAETLRSLVEMIFSTSEHELSCEDCFDRVDQFAELQLAGKDAAAAMPLVQDHLSRCKCCHEEFEALLKAIQAIS
jgi:hypothetical protein